MTWQPPDDSRGLTPETIEQLRTEGREARRAFQEMGKKAINDPGGLCPRCERRNPHLAQRLTAPMYRAIARLNSMSQIRDPAGTINGIVDFGLFGDCFRGSCNFTDIDASIEMNNHWLDIEWKGPGAELPTGQRLSIERRAKHGRTTTFVIWGPPDIPLMMQICYEGGEWGPVDNADMFHVKRRIADWVSWITPVMRYESLADDARAAISGWVEALS